MLELLLLGVHDLGTFLVVRAGRATCRFCFCKPNPVGAVRFKYTSSAQKKFCSTTEKVRAAQRCVAFAISAVSSFRGTLGVDETWPKQFGKSHGKLARYRTVRSSFFCLLLSVAFT